MFEISKLMHSELFRMELNFKFIIRSPGRVVMGGDWREFESQHRILVYGSWIQTHDLQITSLVP